MSNDSQFESFRAFFGKDGLEGLFDKLDEFFKKGPKITRHTVSSKTAERWDYQESLMTELLTTLAGKGLLTNAEAKDVITRAKERAKKKSEEQIQDDVIQDDRPHRQLACARCKKTTSHLIEGNVARCRVCVTARLAS